MPAIHSHLVFADECMVVLPVVAEHRMQVVPAAFDAGIVHLLNVELSVGGTCVRNNVWDGI